MLAPIKEEKAAVTAVTRLDSGYVLMSIKSPHTAATANPGQFVMVRTSGAFDPLLRRPLGILDTGDSRLRLYFQVIGRGTALLAALEAGDRLDLLGPLGKPFPGFSGRRILLIAGGRGIVPLFFYATVFAAANSMFMAYGGKRRQDLHLLDELARLPLKKTYLYSEDGGYGRKGQVTDELEAITAAEGIQTTFSCGPEGMLQAVHKKIGGLALDNFVSLEALMGCGFGICHSCVIPASDGRYIKVCEEGPLFRMEELQWPT